MDEMTRIEENSKALEGELSKNPVCQGLRVRTDLERLQPGGHNFEVWAGKILNILSGILRQLIGPCHGPTGTATIRPPIAQAHGKWVASTNHSSHRTRQRIMTGGCSLERRRSDEWLATQSSETDQLVIQHALLGSEDHVLYAF